MTSHEIRQKFLDFFASKGHQIVPSSPMVLKNDPTLMFTNSGMAQFKDFFLGNKIPQNRRIADTQKCLRVTGKHNDLEDVGKDTYHHTMFEMLGNWSFGDYFKEEAIAWSWELLTEVYQLPKERLYATVFEGDKKENLETDTEALEIWKKYLPENQILFGNKKDNFWEMGETGPCGPCSEIHIDLRPQTEIDKKAGRELVNGSDPQVIEIWNNVFMQFERMADKSLKSLPEKHVDTGMGFERLCVAIQGKTSNYDTDVFSNTLNFLSEKSGIKYGANEKTDIALRVIADHIRAVSFAIADGQMPSNNKAGYVIRRILRRAVRYGYSYLGFKEPFMYQLVALLVKQFEQVFPELLAQKDFVTNVIREEETAFLRTLSIGLERLESIITSTKEQNKTQISGEIVFELYDTFGFPIDLTALIAEENSLKIDEDGFKNAMQIQKDRARAAQKQEVSDWININTTDKINFVGYDEVSTQSKIIKYRKINTFEKEFYQIVLDKTPFYAESGGQVGDTGAFHIRLHTYDTKIEIFDTKKENDLIIHLTEDDNWIGFGEQYLKEAVIQAKINENRRDLIANNHSATHLMHSALREALGEHVAQRGSLVNDKILRFDFSHFTKMNEDEILKVEKRVNEKIRASINLDEQRNIPFQKAVDELNATALFGEKYGEFVRVITFDKNYSVELCGGTHVKNTSQINRFKIISEGSVSAGVRRIEAITGEEAENYFKEQENLLNDLKDILKNPKDLKKAVLDLLEEKQHLLKKIEHFENEKVNQLKDELLAKIENKNNIQFIVAQVNVPSSDALKQLSFDLKQKTSNLLAILVAEIDGKPLISVMIDEKLVKEKNIHAGNIVKDLAKEIQGGGGGQPFYATAGGKDVNGLAKVLEKAKNLSF
ncbi:MAG: alanine--tRNA ligase [Bacteroidetes bacterium]|nr:MAG: alanine--tRNA ligase [Bacteroidota bacterium]TAG91698.1 MAG: alanine--tRNA ligase [Bacteroidota bacterium]